MDNSQVTVTLSTSDYHLLVTAVDRYWSDAHHQVNEPLEQKLDALAENLKEQKLANRITGGA